MKATKLLLIALSCLLIVGCKKSQNEPKEPLPQETPTVITEEQLMSYFPYKNADRLVFRGSTYDVTYTVLECRATKSDDKMIVNVSMTGSTYLTDGYYMIVKIVVTDQQLKMDFSQNIADIGTEGTYLLDLSKGEKLPETITLSNNAVIKKNEGIVSYIDGYSDKWYFLKRL